MGSKKTAKAPVWSSSSVFPGPHTGLSFRWGMGGRWPATAGKVYLSSCGPPHPPGKVYLSFCGPPHPP